MDVTRRRYRTNAWNLLRGVPVALGAACVGAALTSCDGATASDVANAAPSSLALSWNVTKGYNGLVFRSPPEVTVQTATGRLITVPGTIVAAQVASGTARLIGNTLAVTRADGRAIFTDLGVQGFGSIVLRFVADSLRPVTSATVVVAEPAVAIAVASQPFFVPTGAALSGLQVVPRNAYGDDTREEGLLVVASLASGSGSLQGITSVPTDTNGVARFSALSIVGFGPHTLRLTTTGLPTLSTQTINVEQRATALGLSVQPAGVSSGLLIRTQPHVQLRDAQSASVSQRNVLVSVSLAAGSGTLYGMRNVVTNDQGVAVFADLSISGAGSHTLRFESANLNSVVSDALVLPPFELAFGLDRFAQIRAGTFTMGSEVGFGNERPLHRVTISNDYYLAKTEVTQSQYGAVMGRNPSVFVGCGECPVENVTLPDIDEFIRRLNVSNPGAGFRLPTEAEWEFAARAGGAADDPALAVAQSWNAGNSGGTTQPVAKRTPNAWGLFDMLGNVSEWVSDWYDDYPASPVTNPVGPAIGTQKVQRGGAWNNPVTLIRVPARQFAEPADAQFGVRSTLGLRLVRTR